MKPPMKPKAPARPTAKRTPPPAKIQAVASRAMPRMVEEDYDDHDESGEPSMKLSHAFIVVLVLHVIAVGGVFAFNMVKANRAASARIVPASESVGPTQPVATKPAVASEAKPAKETAKPLAQTAEPRQLVQPAAPVQAEAKPAAIQQVVAAVPAKPAVVATATKVVAPASTAEAKARTHTVVAGDTLTRVAGLYGASVESIQKANDLPSATALRVGQTLKIPATPAKAVPAPKAVAAAPVETKSAKETVAAPAKPAAIAVASPAPAKPVETVAPAASADTYTVAKGDNPYSIAHRHKVNYEQLLALNGITDPTKLQIGQKLKLPPKMN